MVLVAACAALAAMPAAAVASRAAATDAPPDLVRSPGRQWIDIPTGAGRATLRALVLRPEMPASQHRAAVLIVPGSDGFGAGYVALAEKLRAAGYVAVTGCWFAGASCPEAPPFAGVDGTAIRSVISLLDATGRLSGVDRDRVLALGHSRGATALLDAAARGASVRAIVASAPIVDARIFDGMRDVLPIDDVAAIDVPVLAVHERGDPMVPSRQTAKLVAAMRATNGSVEVRWFTGRTHATPWTQPAAFLDAVLKFFGSQAAA